MQIYSILAQRCSINASIRPQWLYHLWPKLTGKARALLSQLERQVKDPVITPTAGTVHQELPVRKLDAELKCYFLALVSCLVADTDGEGK